MKNRITLLIIASIATLLALSGIQAYLINNTYELKKEAFFKEANDAISDIDDEATLDSLMFDVWGEDLRNHLADYKNNRISKEDVIRNFSIRADSINPIYVRNYNQILNERDLDYKVKYKKVIISIIIFDGVKTDTIYSNSSDTKRTLFGLDFENKLSRNISAARWFTEHEFIFQSRDSFVTSSFDLEVKTEDKMLIQNWRTVVYSRLAGLLLGSLLLFSFVIGLLSYSIKNLIKEKKITEVKTDFINNITHELKTPLATLSIATKSLQTNEIQESPEAFGNTINIVERQNERLQKLIDQVMTNSLSSKEIILSKEHVTDRKYLQDLVQDFKLSTQHKDLSIVKDLAENDTLLRIDKFHFTTALMNIMENAIKYGKEKVELHIKTLAKNGEYQIEIKDNGRGISKKDQENLFDKFFRVSDGNVHNTKGLGLGLYYTAQIIQAHNGHIEVESELNQGTTFRIKIPSN